MTSLITLKLANTASLRGTLRATCTRTPARFAAGTEQPGQACAGAIVAGRFAAHALRAVKQFLWLDVGSVKVSFSRPTHQYPAGHTSLGKNTLEGASRTRAVGRQT
jgi:hypothetical protein